MTCLFDELKWKSLIKCDMEIEPFEDPWLKRVRLLAHLLWMSLSCNLLFIGLFCFIFFYRHPFSSQQEQEKGFVHRTMAMEETNGQLLSSCFQLSFSELVNMLHDTSIIEDGFSKRDFALAYLVHYHYFPVYKAVSGKIFRTRQLAFLHRDGGEKLYLPIFLDMRDEDFSRIIHFLEREEWPFSPEGLFYQLQRRGDNAPLSLMDAFFSTSHFRILYAVFLRVARNLSKDYLLSLLLEGDWNYFDHWIREIQQGEGQFLEIVRKYLRDYVRLGSAKAAHIWLVIDDDFIRKKLNDEEMIHVIRKLTFCDRSANLFLKKVLCGVRSDTVRREAALKLYELAEITPPVPYSYEQAIQTFLPFLLQEKLEFLKNKSNLTERRKGIQQRNVEKKKAIRIHCVVEGDNLWKIARKYNLSIGQLQKFNALEGSLLKPGQTLVISPEKE